MINVPQNTTALNENEAKLHKALLEFSSIFTKMKYPYVSEDGFRYTCLEAERGFTVSAKINNKSIKFIRFAQLADALDKLHKAFPDLKGLKQETRKSLKALYEFYMECAYSFVSQETVSFPVFSNLMPGGQGRILDCFELFYYLNDEMEKKHIDLSTNPIEFVPLHLLRMQLGNLKVRLGSIECNALQDEEMRNAMIALSKNNFFVPYESVIEHQKNLAIQDATDYSKLFSRDKFLSTAFKLSRPLWSLVVAKLLSELFVQLMQLKDEETIFVARASCAFVMMLNAIPSLVSNTRELLGIFIYLLYTAMLVAYQNQNTNGRMLLGVVLELNSLMREAHSPNEILFNAFLAEFERHKELMSNELPDEDGDTFFDSLEGPETVESDEIKSSTPLSRRI